MYDVSQSFSFHTSVIVAHCVISLLASPTRHRGRIDENDGIPVWDKDDVKLDIFDEQDDTFQTQCYSLFKFLSITLTKIPNVVTDGLCIGNGDETHECPTTLPRRQDGTNIFSTCPWKYIDNYDPQREPMLIRNVTCLCQTCRSIEVTRSGKFIEEETSDSTCAAIQLNMPVLRWKDRR